MNLENDRKLFRHTIKQLRLSFERKGNKSSDKKQFDCEFKTSFIKK